MSEHTKYLLEDPEGLIAIHPSLTSLRTAVANEYKLQKEETAYDDTLDSFKLSQ